MKPRVPTYDPLPPREAASGRAQRRSIHDAPVIPDPPRSLPEGLRKEPPTGDRCEQHVYAEENGEGEDYGEDMFWELYKAELVKEGLCEIPEVGMGGDS